MSNRRFVPISGKYTQSDEYRKKLRVKHILEGVCFALSFVMITLGVLFATDLDRSMWIPTAVVILGTILNFTLTVRGYISKEWLLFAGAGTGFVACLTGFCYLIWT